MKKNQIVITETYQSLLKRHYKETELSMVNKNQLLAELESAQIMDEKDLPENVVCAGSEVELQEMASGKKFTFILVYPVEANMKLNKVSITSPIGIAVIGYNKGSYVNWEMPGGMKSFRILNVRQKALKGS
ncbi:MAG: Transcription elongation factor GreA [Daejeonella sp.]|nr:Transcription elongation factor GreA [Daejeonella sp.]